MITHHQLRTFAIFGSALCFSLLTVGCASAAKHADMRDWSTTQTKEGIELVRYPKDRTRLIGRITEDTQGEKTFTVEEVRWFSNWNDGWTEAVLLAEGSARLIPGKKGKTSAIFTEPVILDTPQSAAMRYRNTVIRGTDGTAAFSRRLDRISAAVFFLIENQDRVNTVPDRKTFIKSSGTFLFPEVYGYSPGTEASPRILENRSMGEGISWDLRYTEIVFSPELAPIRNTGTLFRDWEETSDLFYFIYCMECMKND